MELEPEDGGTPVLIEIEDIKKFYTILSKSALEEYLQVIENKMIEYVSGIVYDNSSRDALSRLNVLTNIRDDLRVYLYPPEQQQGELNG
jgi:subtilisin-like proprotein convertase family protein